MLLLLEEIFTFASLVMTFVYVRCAGAVLRSLLPGIRMADVPVLVRAVLYVSPTSFVAAVLYVLHVQRGLIWISLTAIYISWAQDLLYVIGAIYYYFVLRRLRRLPASSEFSIRLQDYADWPSSDVVRKPLDYLLQRLPVVKRWRTASVLIRPVDFQRFLRSDLRLLDEAEPALLDFSYEDFCAVPHFPFPSLSASHERKTIAGAQGSNSSDPNSALLPTLFPQLAKVKHALQVGPQSLEAKRLQRFHKDRRKHESKSNVPQHYLMNRALNCDLTESLWNTSTLICRTLPSVVARTWKTFHFQESLRLRFVALFNAADLIQRLLGAIVLCRLRDSGNLIEEKLAGEDFQIPLSTRKWSETLEFALKSSDSKMQDLQRLLEPRDDYEIWQSRLEPLVPLLGGPIVFSKHNRHTLAGLRVLAVLRNKIIGHGGVGTHLRMRPLFYLSAVHYFFLSLMAGIIECDVAIFAGTDSEGQRLIIDRGLGAKEHDANRDRAYARVQGKPFEPLYPYLRYHEGRLLFQSRVSKARNWTEYVDYNVARSLEPSLVRLETDWNDYIKPRS